MVLYLQTNRVSLRGDLCLVYLNSLRLLILLYRAKYGASIILEFLALTLYCL